MSMAIVFAEKTVVVGLSFMSMAIVFAEVSTAKLSIRWIDQGKPDWARKRCFYERIFALLINVACIFVILE